MYANLTKFLSDIRASYWFFPSCMVIAAILLSIVMPLLDGRYGARWLGGIDWLTDTRTTGARSVLTIIAGSIIGVAGVTFSITVVAVSYASANFGPRLIGNFMRDRGNQITLGVFIGTFVYCLLVLRIVHEASSGNSAASFDAFVPHLSILMALALALTSVGFLIYFFHHVPETINVSNMTARIGRQLKNEITNLFPDPETIHAEQEQSNQTWEDRIAAMKHTRVDGLDEGYIQTLDEGRLFKVADAKGLLVRVQYRPGDFVIVGDTVLDVWSPDEPDRETIGDLRACFALGRRRTPHQNVLFLADELVEIIARALSPGINDPFTAITCIDWLKVGLVCFMDHEYEKADTDQSGPVRIYPVTFERFASRILEQS
ncbi:MAG: DUF2254 domain-containing protein, partial [Rhodobacteraceae bacterium]|nr:DUF2254 domain-containing protein [Paracoccaceae bacterium]